METTREYKLLKTYDGVKMHVVKGGFTSESAAMEHAMKCQGRDEKEFRVQLVTTMTSITNIFNVPALPPPTLDEIAQEIASVYCGSTDYSGEDFIRLSEEDKQKVRQMVMEDTDDCEICGWTFHSNYLSHGDHGLICDRCEDNIEDDEEDDDNED